MSRSKRRQINIRLILWEVLMVVALILLIGMAPSPPPEMVQILGAMWKGLMGR